MVYVADNPANDFVPAKLQGLRTPSARAWGYLWANDQVVTDSADWRVNDLFELGNFLAE